MRKTSLSLCKTRVNGILYWRVTIPKLGGGRERKTFRNHADAETAFKNAKTEQENHGTAALSMPEKLRVEATEGARRLAEHGKTLRDAVDFMIAHLESIANSKKVSDVIKDILEAREKDGASDRYVGDLRARLNKFGETFGEQMIAGITAREIAEWLRARGTSGVTKNSYRRRLAALFTFARRNGYLKVNPIEDVEQAKERCGDIQILTPERTADLLAKASDETLPYWAIQAFAGLRSSEIELLEWSDIDLKSKVGFINVKAGNAKTRRRRLVPILPALKAWLADYKDKKGPVCPAGLRKRLEADRDAAKLRADWPKNCLRHGYGSYRLPIITDAAKLALEMGNSPAMIFRHYREVVRPAVAKKFWKIRPSKKAAEKIVAMAA